MDDEGAGVPRFHRQSRFALRQSGKFVGGRHDGAGMRQRLPSATVRPMPDWSGWYVELVWPNGRVEHVDKFGSASTARDWLSRELPAYLADSSSV